MNLRDRIGVDVGRRLNVDDPVEWAAQHDVRWIDIQLDSGANALNSFDDARATGVRRACERHAVHLGLHTASAVNVAETAPYVGDAVERYLKAMSRLRRGSVPNGSSCMRASTSPPLKSGVWPPVL